MSRQSTALLTIGPRSIAPWGDRVWRVSGTAQLVEGSTPYWIVTPTAPASHPASPAEVEVVVPHPEAVVDSVLMFLGAHFGDEHVEAYLVETHNLTVRDGVREIAPCYELAEATVQFLADHLSKTIRLGVTRLDDVSLLDGRALASLRELGFDLEVYKPVLGAAAG